MAEKFNFTQSKITNLKPPPPTAEGKGTRVTYYDTTQPKLVLRVSSSGGKVFYVIKKDQANRTKFVRLGSFSEITVADARDKATEALTEINKGVDPIEKKRKQRMRSQSLQALLDAYVDDHQNLKPITITDYRRKLSWGFSDWMTAPASGITEKMVMARHKKLTALGKTATNGAFRALRAILNYARATGAIDHNPVEILSAARLWHKENRKTDMILSHQLGEWVGAVDQVVPPMHRVAFLMMLYMGFRITETYKLEWKDINLNAELLIQRDTKNGTDHELPIPTVLIPLIKELQDETGGGRYLFPATKRDSYHGRPKRQLDQLNKVLSFHFNPHMARHTFTTIAEAVNIPKTMIDRLTNHTTSNDVTGGYIHTETETLREAINKIAAYIQAKITSDEKVVKLYG